MLVSDSSKHQPEFDLARARAVFADSGHDRGLMSDHITSPFHLYSVEELRSRFGFRIGRSVPADVFVFGKGEPKQRDCTKIGGMPYWPKNKAWPKSKQGRPFQFLAQVNFADSRDIANDLPGDVLLLLVPNDGEWQWGSVDIHLEWFPSGIDVVDEFDASLIATNAGPFFGAIYRTADYPDLPQEFDAQTRINTDGLSVLNATKIGGIPYLVQGSFADDADHICQIGTVFPASRVPYPWVNDWHPLGMTEDEDGFRGPTNMLDIGDMGFIYVFRDQKGRFKSTMQCY